MKRQMIIGLMLAAAFTLTNCSEQLVSPEKEQINVDENIGNTTQEEMIATPFEIYVDGPETKTITDGTYTYWVDEASAIANGLGKDAVDRVTIYTKNGNKYTYHGKYTYAGNKKFSGDFYGQFANENTWYCIYPFNSKSSADNNTDLKENLIIGASKDNNYTVTQDCANSRIHIAGKNYPMLGTTNTQGDANPTFTMGHLSALVALKIVNNGAGGDVIINRASFGIPTVLDETGKNTKQTAIPIVGQFEVDFSGTDPLYTASATSSSQVNIALENNITLAKGQEAILYAAVRPLDISKKVIEVSVNGISRRVELPANTTLESGKITTFNIPINDLPIMGYALTSNAFDSKYITATNIHKTNISINGENVQAYILGSTDDVGSITVTGLVIDLIDEVPVEFYATSLNSHQAIMKVKSINMQGLPLDYSTLKGILSNPDNRLFKGLIPLEYFYEDNTGKILGGNVTILDEETPHKPIGATNIENLLKTRISKDCSFEGLKEAIKNPDAIDDKDSEAYKTAAAIYNVLDIKLGWGLKIIGAGSPKKLFQKASTLEISVTLETLSKTDTSEPEGYKATDNRIAIWGFNLKAKKTN